MDSVAIRDMFKDNENEFDYVPVERESSSICVHRVPYEGRKMILECFPSYFKVGQLLPSSEIDFTPNKNKSFFSIWWKKKDPLQFDPSKLNVSPRFIVFEDGFLMFLKYQRPHTTRDFGIFNLEEARKKLPEMVFDSEVTYQRHLKDLFRLHLMNFD